MTLKKLDDTKINSNEEEITSKNENLNNNDKVEKQDNEEENLKEKEENINNTSDENSESESESDDNELLHKSFEDLGLSHWLIDATNNLSMKKPTEIQSACIPEILAGKDVIGSAKTGSGKTAAFALPILQKLAEDPFGVFALILTPTRELAFQIAEQFRALGSSINLKQSIIVGGLDMMTQAIELSRKPHIVIATPGRLVDHINSSTNAIHFKRIKFLVLDEVDRLLDNTFASSLEIILNELPKNRQTLLFSATITPEIEELKNSSKKEMFVYRCNERFDVVEKLVQKYLFIPSMIKDVYLSYILNNCFEDKTIIIFTGKCRTCERLNIMLRELGYRTTSLHAIMSQNERLSSLAKFKSKIVKILIATDVAGRGLDIENVQVVINYDIPASPVDYIHRIGRTARAGRGGISLSLITEHDIELIQNIESLTKKKLIEYEGINENEVLKIMDKVNLAKRVANMHLIDTNFGEKKIINKTKRERSNQKQKNKKAKKVKKSKN
ncbi:DEAD-domain-containing protein [Anaeromyces robustus]|uniref:DEAD-domain-containing protein n=1 Tax=Anaeromyces robustus TaxID=1754192 RepID=A0A1Y1X6U0_9FUNG|nr:DEAD-domain-containing protein [Anaeromyces robustus]|eukprot:ORX81507.1 DEAD-domain-containing protein [Anaeromyces robustus]